MQQTKKGNNKKKKHKISTKLIVNNIKTVAENKKSQYPELFSRVDGQDLLAREAHYHSSCYNNIILLDIPNDIQDICNNNSDTKISMEAHSSAFSYLCTYVQDSIIEKCNVERMTMLKE